MIGKNVVKEIEAKFNKELERYNKSHLKAVPRKRLLGTLFFNLYEIGKLQDNLDPFVLVGIKQLMNQISDELIQYTFTHFFGNLYQIEYSLLSKNYEELQNRLSWTIYDLYTMHVQILQGSSLSDSLGGSFFDRLKGLVKTDCALIDSRSTAFFKLAVINLCTVNAVLVDYIHKVNGEHREIAKNYLRSSFNTLRKAFLEIEKDSSNLSLMLFVYLTLKKQATILDEKIEPVEVEYENLMKKLGSEAQNLRAYDLILCICSLYELDKEKFMELFNENFPRLSTEGVHWTQRPFYVRMLIFFIQESNMKDRIELSTHPRFNPFDMRDTLNRLFPEYLSPGVEISVGNADLEKLMSYDDSQIRKKLVKIFRRSDHISEKEKRRLEEEARKPHTGHEISDFEVQLDSDLFVCMPIKSAKEITTSVPEKYVYQIMKPFVKLYDKCAVVFITSMRCSQSLDAYIKQLKVLYEFPIEVIQERHLCSLLKFYGQLD